MDSKNNRVKTPILWDKMKLAFAAAPAKELMIVMALLFALFLFYKFARKRTPETHAVLPKESSRKSPAVKPPPTANESLEIEPPPSKLSECKDSIELARAKIEKHEEFEAVQEAVHEEENTLGSASQENQSTEKLEETQIEPQIEPQVESRQETETKASRKSSIFGNRKSIFRRASRNSSVQDAAQSVTKESASDSHEQVATTSRKSSIFGRKLSLFRRSSRGTSANGSASSLSGGNVMTEGETTKGMCSVDSNTTEPRHLRLDIDETSSSVSSTVKSPYGSHTSTHPPSRRESHSVEVDMMLDNIHVEEEETEDADRPSTSSRRQSVTEKGLDVSPHTSPLSSTVSSGRSVSSPKAISASSKRSSLLVQHSTELDKMLDNIHDEETGTDRERPRAHSKASPSSSRAVSGGSKEGSVHSKASRSSSRAVSGGSKEGSVHSKASRSSNRAVSGGSKEGRVNLKASRSSSREASGGSKEGSVHSKASRSSSREAREGSVHPKASRSSRREASGGSKEGSVHSKGSRSSESAHGSIESKNSSAHSEDGSHSATKDNERHSRKASVHSKGSRSSGEEGKHEPVQLKESSASEESKASSAHENENTQQSRREVNVHSKTNSSSKGEDKLEPEDQPE